jgi:DNA replication protein DnaC
MTTIRALQEKLSYLKMDASLAYVNELFMLGKIDDTSIDLLYQVIDAQHRFKEENNRLYNVKVAGFPYIKTLDEFDFSFQPSINETQIRNIAASNFYQEATNIAFIGTPGVGKTHLAISIGVCVATKRTSVYFIKFSKLINQLKRAYDENKLEHQIKVYNKYKLLIIDEVGFNEISMLEAKLFFQLVDIRYEKKSTIFTSNITFDKWVGIMGNDEMITRAILDRIIHHSYLFNIVGNSYRIKDKLEVSDEDSC